MAEHITPEELRDAADDEVGNDLGDGRALRAAAATIEALEAENHPAQPVSDAEFIAAADPDVVRALVAEVRESRRIIERVRAILDDEPECQEHPDGDLVTCGWKLDILCIRRVIGGGK